jgi:hypothetical protein
MAMIMELLPEQKVEGHAVGAGGRDGGAHSADPDSRQDSLSPFDHF